MNQKWGGVMETSSTTCKSQQPLCRGVWNVLSAHCRGSCWEQTCTTPGRFCKDARKANNINWILLGRGWWGCYSEDACRFFFKQSSFEMWHPECKQKLGKQRQGSRVGHLRVLWRAVHPWAWWHHKWHTQGRDSFCWAGASPEIPGWCQQRALQHSQWRQQPLWSKTTIKGLLWAMQLGFLSARVGEGVVSRWAPWNNVQFDAVFLCSLLFFVALRQRYYKASRFLNLYRDWEWVDVELDAAFFLSLLEKAALFYGLYFSKVVKLVTELSEELSHRFCVFFLTW